MRDWKLHDKLTTTSVSNKKILFILSDNLSFTAFKKLSPLEKTSDWSNFLIFNRKNQQINRFESRKFNYNLKGNDFFRPSEKD